MFPRELGSRFKMMPAFEEAINSKLESSMGRHLRIKGDATGGSNVMDDV